MCLIKLLPFPTQLRNAAHDILFDQEPCSATGSNLSCVPSSPYIAEPWVMTVSIAGSSQVSWIAQTVMSLLVESRHVRFVNVLPDRARSTSQRLLYRGVRSGGTGY
jgi:hypothetical protein